MIQWLRLHTSNAGDKSSIPRWGIKISHAVSVQFRCSVMSDSLRPYGLQHTRLPCPSPTPGACSNSCPLSPFLVSQFFASGGWSIWVSASASVLAMNIQGWFPLGLTDLRQSKGISRVFSNTTIQKHQFFGAQLSLYSNSHIHIHYIHHITSIISITSPLTTTYCIAWPKIKLH